MTAVEKQNCVLVISTENKVIVIAIARQDSNYMYKGDEYEWNI